MFSRGDLSHGCGNACRTVWQGHRSNSTAYLANGYPNLTVLTNTVVLQILLEDYDGGLKATGVAVLEGKENTKRVIKADGEIILAAGAYGSPHVCISLSKPPGAGSKLISASSFFCYLGLGRRNI